MILEAVLDASKDIDLISYFFVEEVKYLGFIPVLRDMSQSQKVLYLALTPYKPARKKSRFSGNTPSYDLKKIFLR